MPAPGVSEDNNVRQTARSREIVRPMPSHRAVDGFSMTHAYVRTFWVAAIGPGAVADLLRLAAAAQSGRSLKMPTHLAVLAREGLAGRDESGTIRVPAIVPKLTPTQAHRLPPRLRREHQFVKDMGRPDTV